MDGMIGLIIQIVAGVIGGNLAGAEAKNLSLGTTGNSIAGAIGGLILGQILGGLGIGSPPMATDGVPGGFDVGALVGQMLGGGVGGAALTAIVGLIGKQMRA